MHNRHLKKGLTQQTLVAILVVLALGLLLMFILGQFFDFGGNVIDDALE